MGDGVLSAGRPRLRIAESPAAASTPYAAVTSDARLRADVLAGKMRRVQAALSGAFTTSAALAEARRLVAEIERDFPAFRKALS